MPPASVLDKRPARRTRVVQRTPRRIPATRAPVGPRRDAAAARPTERDRPSTRPAAPTPMSPTLRRRLRGTFGTMALWGATWGAGSGLTGLALWIALARVRTSVDLLELCAAMTVAGTFVGAVCGLAFALVLAASARFGRGGDATVEGLRVARFGAWGALGAVVGALLLSRDPAFLVTCATLGAGAAGGTLVVARRAVRAPDEPALLPGA